MAVRILKTWILVVFIVTAFSGTIYWTVQQDYRQTTYDPQIQMAQDAAGALSNGGKVKDYNTASKIDVSKSLAPFIVIYDVKGNPIASSGNLNGQDPTLPTGVLDFTKTNGVDRITWQPQDNTRIATVVDYYSSATQSGYVLAGRNMHETESRIEKLLGEVAIGWAATVFGSLVLIGILEMIFPSKKK